MKFYKFTFIVLLFSCGNDDAMQPILQGEDFSNDLFFSEYVEGTSYNKALEIVNLTGQDIDFETTYYSIKKQVNGQDDWTDELRLTGSFPHRTVFVLGNENADIPDIINNSDMLLSGSPLDFDGNDPIGLFKNGELIDVVGNFNDPGNYGKDLGLRRKFEDTSPSIIFNVSNWEIWEVNNVGDLGRYY